jgi:hypothetical protein
VAIADILPATPRSLVDPGAPPTPVKTLSRWTLFLGEIACGTSVQDAMLKHYMKRADIEACVRASPEERVRWNDARMAGRKTKWSAFDIEEIFGHIASGTPIKESVDLVRSGQAKEFSFLCASDPEFNRMYLEAVKARAIGASEEILKIADGDGEGDYLDNGKGGFVPDNAKVNRDKLRVDTRSKLMGAWYGKLFGEKKGDVQVNVQVNHAERLEQARQRRDWRTSTRGLTPEVIEAAFKSLPDAIPPPAVEKAEWDDVPAVEAVSSEWREES